MPFSIDIKRISTYL